MLLRVIMRIIFRAGVKKHCLRIFTRRCWRSLILLGAGILSGHCQAPADRFQRH